MRMIFILTLLFLQSSCVSMMVKKAGLTETEPVLKKLPINGKEVYFLEMRHLGQKEFYKNVTVLIDSLSRLGYSFYCEGTKPRKEGQPYTDTLASKKMRKLLNMDLSIQYIETNNSIIQDLIKKYELVGQPGYKELGASDYKIVDVSYVDLVQRFESQYGIVELDSCDLNTNLGQGYSCQTVSRAKRQLFDKEFIHAEREKSVALNIKNSADKKILVVFGLLHYGGIKKELNKLEN